MIATSTPALRRGVLFVFTVLTLSGLAGCGRGVADASGRVTHKGKPVVCGSVTLVGPDGMTKTARINPDGTYSISGVGAGTVKVAVMSDDPARPLDPYKAAASHGKTATEPVDDTERSPEVARPKPPAPNDKSNWTEPNVDRSKWYPLPKKYELPATSGMTVELNAGANVIDIDLP